MKFELHFVSRPPGILFSWVEIIYTESETMADHIGALKAQSYGSEFIYSMEGKVYG